MKYFLFSLSILIGFSQQSLAQNGTCVESLNSSHESISGKNVSPEKITRIEKWIEQVNKNRDTSQATSPDLLVHRNEQGKVIKTNLSVLTVHGLYNHPGWMRDLSQSYYQTGYNVYNTKLPGHFEQNKTALDHASRAEWYQSVAGDLSMAQELGEKVIIVGHSLGGALALRTALRFPEHVAGIILLAPVLEVETWPAVKAWLTSKSWFGFGPHLMKLIGISRYDEHQRYLSSKAAVEAGRILDDLEAMGPDQEWAFQQLKNVAVMMVNTNAETTVDLETNYRAMNHLLEVAHHPKSTSLVVPDVLHRYVPMKDPQLNSDYSKVEAGTLNFMNSLTAH
jgi:alpha-beta hydrolase superfamily lysophospholipase